MTGESLNNERLFDSRLLFNIATFVVFVWSICALPSIFFCYLCIQSLRSIWLKFLSNRFPNLNFVKTTSIRTLLDNHRNQGVINVIMIIKGVCDPMLIHQSLLDQVLDKRDKAGNLQFPKLRAGLVSCWGNYAWKMNVPFNLENHLIMGKPTHRGRPITDRNIQDYINDIVTRYLPTNSPPWQVIIVPNYGSGEEKYGLLIRIHHLLIADEEPLNIGDFLLLKPENEVNFEPIPSSTDRYINEDLVRSPFSGVLESLTSMTKLFNILNDSLSNRWNEFIAEYDPIESPKLSEMNFGFFQCIAIILISFVFVCKELHKSSLIYSYDTASIILYFLSAFNKENARRGLTPFVFIMSLWITFNPFSFIIHTYKVTSYLLYFFTVKLFFIFYNELMVLLSHKEYCTEQDTLVEFIQDYIPLFYSALEELFNIFKLIYTGPMSLLNELSTLINETEQNQLQTVSLCGRKVIAWSQPIPRKHVRDIAKTMRVSETEILLNMTSNCVREYFRHSGHPVPKKLLMTARTVACDTLLASIERNGYKETLDTEGIVCISLPLHRSHQGTMKEEIMNLNKAIRRVRERQGAIFALGNKHTLIVKLLPSVFARLVLNYLSRKFSVTLTEVADSGHDSPRSTQWGHTVQSFVCWRPPQGNICMSITLQRYADAVRIGVMADALLAPHHMAIARHWHKAVRKISANLESTHH